MTKALKFVVMLLVLVAICFGAGFAAGFGGTRWGVGPGWTKVAAQAMAAAGIVALGMYLRRRSGRQAP